MKISINTGCIIPTLGIEKGFQMIADAGFDGVDFNFNSQLPYSNVVNGLTASIFDGTEKEVLAFYRPYLEAMKQFGLSMEQSHAAFPSYTPNEVMNEAIINTILKSLPVCAEAGCPYIIVHPYFAAYAQRFDAETQWQVNRAFYERLIPAAKDCGVGMCLENMFTNYRSRIYSSACSDMDEAREYVDRLNDIAGMELFSFCYDTGHQTVLGQDMRASLNKLGKRVKTLHVHDNDGRGDNHSAPYTGVSDWEAFIAGLQDIDYQGTISFETGPKNYPMELWLNILSFIAATGRYFSSRLEGQQH